MSESSFIMAKMVSQVMGSTLIEIPLKNFTHDLEAMLDSITESTKIIYLDNPMNPIGTMKTEKDISDFMDRVPDDVIVVFDEAYYEYINRSDYPDSLRYVREGRSVLILRTFSKMYGMAGLRVGYGIADEDFVNALKKVSPPFSVNRFAQNGAAAALEDVDHFQRTLSINETGKNYLYENFDRMSVFYIPSETNFVTVDIKTDAKKICRDFEKEGVIIRPLTMYGKPTFFRVTIGTPEQNRKFIKVLEQILLN
jgi:histidinol-phosphate aminotransferase